MPIRVMRGTVELVDTSFATARSWRMHDIESTIRPRSRRRWRSPRVAPFYWTLPGPGIIAVAAPPRCDLTRRTTGRPRSRRRRFRCPPNSFRPCRGNCPRGLGTWRACRAICGVRWHAEHRPEWESPRDSRRRANCPTAASSILFLAFPLTEIAGSVSVRRTAVGGGPVFVSLRRSVSSPARRLGRWQRPTKPRLKAPWNDCGWMRPSAVRCRRPWQVRTKRSRREVMSTRSFDFVRQDGQWQPRIEVHCREVSFAWQRIPVPIDKSTGTVVMAPTAWHLMSRGYSMDRPVHLRGEIQDPARHGVGWCDYETPRAGATRRTFDFDAARPPPARHSPAGTRRNDPLVGPGVSSDGRVTPLEFQSSIDVSDATIRVAAFPYPLHHVAGHVEQRGDQWLFQQFTGKNDSGEFHKSTANGLRSEESWRPIGIGNLTGFARPIGRRTPCSVVAGCAAIVAPIAAQSG